MFSENIYYVYLLIDPRVNQPFYVGKGKGDRVKQHYYNWTVNKRHNVHKLNIINKLKMQGFVPTYELAATGFKTSKDAGEYEKHLISLWGREWYDKDGILTNVAPGGEGGPGAAKGVDRSHLNKSVIQYSVYGEYITTHKSFKIAAEAVNGSFTAISEAARKTGRASKPYGFVWVLAGEKPDWGWVHRKGDRPVYQWTTEGYFVARFRSALKACEQFGVKDSSMVKRCCEGHKHSYHKFLWTYGNQPTVE